MKIWFWLKNSRIFSLPMAILSWLVVFVYSLKFGGNVLNGFVALIGVSFAQLATNLFDDFLDFKCLTENSQQCKCAYIKDGKATIKDVFKVVLIYLAISAITGLFLLFRAGYPVIFLALLGGIITLFYSKLSRIGLSEFAVGIAFGPLLFEGIYFVMTKSFSFEVLILSLAVVMFTIGLMYVHTVLDFEGDMCSHKKTLVCRLNDKNKAINGVFVVYGFGFLFTIILAFVLKNYKILLTLALIPLIFNLHKSLKDFTCGDEEKEFYKRLLKARNLMIFYSLILVLFLL